MTRRKWTVGEVERELPFSVIVDNPRNGTDLRPDIEAWLEGLVGELYSLTLCIGPTTFEEKWSARLANETDAVAFKLRWS